MCEVMGIVNVTPDSFSDGGRFYSPEQAIARARNLIEEGADVIDIGGESTKPGTVPIPWEEEWRRIEPVLQGLAQVRNRPKTGTVPLSVDTYHPETAARALGLGATIINCVYAEPIGEMLRICAEKGAKLVIPSKALGTVPVSLRDGLLGTVPVYLDPMIGFGTTREEDVELLRSIPELAKKGLVLVGASRKRIVKKLTGEKVTGKNLGGNIGIAVWAAMNGASMVRVHDVRETVQAIKVVESLGGVVAI
ncbi:MAG: dihydropteroate synthase [Kiritimatiellae bacterium]|nr:dihydropteroate synthase [Kiritimatiellia bacterium]